MPKLSKNCFVVMERVLKIATKIDRATLTGCERFLSRSDRQLPWRSKLYGGKADAHD